MALSDIDFEGTDNQSVNTKSVDDSSDVVEQEDKTDLNGSDVDDVTGKDNTDTDVVDNNPSTGELNVGDSLIIDDKNYTVDKNGNIIDDKGNIFKEAKDVQEWLKSVEVDNNSNNNETDMSVASIQQAIGITVTDEEGNPIEFTNDANGVKAYVDSVIDIKSQELQEAAINRLYQDNPLLKQFKDYVEINGSYRGFGEIPDRSGIVLDKDNEQQLIAVIKMAASEFGNKSLNDNYINYLKNSNGLYDEAKSQLSALVEKDMNYRKEVEELAAKKRAEEYTRLNNYWKDVNDVISKRVISGYRIPESFTKEVDGKKVVYTPNDFYKYIHDPIKTENGQTITGYLRDLNNLSNSDYMNREILDAWLMFTGGTYKDLIDLAVKEDKVRQLRIKSQERRSNKTVKVIKHNVKSSIDDILL